MSHSRCTCDDRGAFRFEPSYDCVVHGMLAVEPVGVVPTTDEDKQP